ncbi:hypothetical protein JW962_02770, partial [Candidatus Dojkabacteria bacterium]|nr:hypothetical protein [Candidatus Dojkabacteria bacterium]
MTLKLSNSPRFSGAYLYWLTTLCITLLFAIFYILPISGVFAADGINETISVQGRLVNSDGTNFSGACGNSCDMRFTLYETCSGTPFQVSQETFDDVTLVDGIFNVRLGEGSGSNLGSLDFNDDDMCVLVEIDIDDNSSYGGIGTDEYFGTLELAAVPYAFNAKYLGGQELSDIQLWTKTGTNLSPLTAGDDILLSNGETLTITDSSVSTGKILSISSSSTSNTGSIADITLTGLGDGLSINSSSTTSLNAALRVSQTGATTQISGTDYAGYFSNTGTGSMSIGIYSTASGSSNNYAAYFDGDLFVSPGDGSDGYMTVTSDSILLSVEALSLQAVSFISEFDTTSASTEYAGMIGGYTSIESGTIAGLTGLKVNSGVGSSGTVSTLIGIDTEVYVGYELGSADSAIGLNISISNSGTIGTAYGIKIGDMQGTLSYGIYQEGSDDINYFAGNLGIGTTSPGAALDVAGNLLLSGTDRYINFSATEGT